MDLYEELNAYMSTYHPSIKLGNEELAQIKYSEQHSAAPHAEACTVNVEAPSKARKKVAKKQGQIKKDERVVIDLDLPVKRQRETESSVCPICQWIFPNNYSDEDMSGHVNKCIDGEGAEDIKTFRKNNRKSKKKKKKTHRKENFVQEIIENDEKIDDYEECSSCLLNFNSLAESFKEKHKILCCKEQEIVIKQIMKKY
jgi:hypothetical protein